MKRLPELINDLVCVLKNMQMVSLTYKPSLTNLEFILGLTENVDEYVKNINDFIYRSLSLRVEDTSVEKSEEVEIIDFRGFICD